MRFKENFRAVDVGSLENCSSAKHNREMLEKINCCNLNTMKAREERKRVLKGAAAIERILFEIAKKRSKISITIDLDELEGENSK
ncbi:hypothetical protein HPP92_013243 [Vanilla planifolia]|uniref:Uncharacterized protein n=1 Tax=Vanilla planifolia TaxID=51239 RepID=A0A835UWJ9_VANPL|nr:hypothetical protein HPP92_013243 [Vanilla planifolia]